MSRFNKAEGLPPRVIQRPRVTRDDADVSLVPDADAIVTSDDTDIAPDMSVVTDADAVPDQTKRSLRRRKNKGNSNG